MRIILFILKKEFRQIFRNKTLLPMIVMLPIVQLIILVNAATLEMKMIKIGIADNDFSVSSRELSGKFQASNFYKIVENSQNIKTHEKLLNEDKIDVILYIPHGFEKKLIKENKSDLQLQVNAINIMTAGLINSYSSMIIAQFNSDFISQHSSIPSNKIKPNVKITNSFWYNPLLNYNIYMVPGILVILVTIIGMFLTALNIVREKEIGTIEQINVTPIKKYQFILGKLIPFWIIAMFELGLGLTIGKIIFDVPIVGSLFTLFSFAGVYLLVVLGLGLFISAISKTQQQVMFLAFFFMIVAVLMSGIFTPVESMPDWAAKANTLNPLAYFMRVIRMILLKGSGFVDILPELIKLSVFAVIINLLAVWKYKKVV